MSKVNHSTIDIEALEDCYNPTLDEVQPIAERFGLQDEGLWRVKEGKLLPKTIADKSELEGSILITGLREAINVAYKRANVFEQSKHTITSQRELMQELFAVSEKIIDVVNRMSIAERGRLGDEFIGDYVEMAQEASFRAHIADNSLKGTRTIRATGFRAFVRSLAGYWREATGKWPDCVMTGSDEADPFAAAWDKKYGIENTQGGFYSGDFYDFVNMCAELDPVSLGVGKGKEHGTLICEMVKRYKEEI